MSDFFKQIFTDALGRPEIKMILGIPLFIGAQIYLIIAGPAVIAAYGAICGTALALMGLTTYGDATIDKK